MRVLLVIVLALGVGVGAFLLLRAPPSSSDVDDVLVPAPVPGEAGRPGRGRAPDSVPIDVKKVPRVGLMSRLDRDLPIDPDAQPWHMRMLVFPGGGADVHLTGKMLIEALSKHLYVRARDQATLDALEKQTFEVMAAHEMPLGAVAQLLKAAGYEADVQDPRINVRRLKDEERPEVPR